MSSLNLLKKNFLRKKSSRIIYLDSNSLVKNNENISKISNSSTNIFSRISRAYIENKQIRKNDKDSKTNNYLFLPKTNISSTKVNNNNFFNDSFSQDSFKNQIFQNKKSNDYSLLSKRKKYLTDFNKNMNNFEYKKKLKRINSSFSPESYYSFDKKLLKDFSSNNILYNSFLFSKNKTTNRNNLHAKKIKISYKNTFFKNKNFKSKIFPNKKLYKYISNGYENRKINNIKALSEKFKEKEKKFEKVLEMENCKIFNNFYSIIDKIKFKKEYQNPFIYDKRDFKNQIKEEYNNLIKPEVFSDHLKLLKEIKEKIGENKRLEKINIEKANNKKLEKFKNLIIRIYLFFKQRNITKDEFKKFKQIKKSFTYKLTKSLIDSIKSKNLNVCSEIIETHKYLVFDFDNFYLTPLHWAVKKNFYEFIPKLLSYGSLVDSLNFSGESPLHIAVKNNFYDSACILLYYLASPFLKDKNGKKPIEVSQNFDMKNLLEKIMMIHYLSYFHCTINQQRFIKTKLWIFINKEFKNKISVFTFHYFKERELLGI